MLDGAIDGYEPLRGRPRRPARRRPLDEERVEGQDMLYSSGTTGRPKGVKVPLPGRAARRGRRRRHHAGARSCSAPTSDTVYLSPAPLYHAAPLRFCRAAHRLGGTVVVMEHFDPEEYLALVEQHRVTFSQVVPTMFIRMLKLPDEVRAQLRPVVAAGAWSTPPRRARPR